MRKNELQASIRLLRNKNTALETLNSQLDMEWKEVMIVKKTLPECHGDLCALGYHLSVIDKFIHVFVLAMCVCVY